MDRKNLGTKCIIIQNLKPRGTAENVNILVLRGTDGELQYVVNIIFRKC